MINRDETKILLIPKKMEHHISLNQKIQRTKELSGRWEDVRLP